MPTRLTVSRRLALGTFAAAGLDVACRAASIAPLLGSPIDELAERYVRLTLELAQHQPSLVEQWLGPDHWRPGARRPVAQLQAEIVDLQAASAREPIADVERLTYLRGQIDGLAVAARRLSGESMTFVEEARASFGAEVAAVVAETDRPSREGEIEAARAILQRRLPGRGPLHERYRDYRVRHGIPVGRLPQVIAAALASCRARVRSRIELPASEEVQLASLNEAGIEGRAQYEGRFRSRIWIALGTIDLARLVRLVAHESYPGHHVQHVLADRRIVLARDWSERRLFPSFGRHLLYAEGAADAGAGLLLEAEHFEELCGALAGAAGVRVDEVADLVAVHRAVTTLDLRIVAVARAYLDGTLASEAAATALREQALVPEATQMLQVIERQRTRVLSYPCGRRLVAAQLEIEPPAHRWTRLAAMATTLTLLPQGDARTS